MGGDTYTFMDTFGAAYTLRTDIERVLGRKLEVHAYTDSRQLFDAITKEKHTLKKGLSIDIAASRDAYTKFKIDRIGLLRGKSNLADGLTEIGGNGALLKILTRKDTTKIVE